MNVLCALHIYSYYDYFILIEYDGRKTGHQPSINNGSCVCVGLTMYVMKMVQKYLKCRALPFIGIRLLLLSLHCIYVWYIHSSYHKQTHKHIDMNKYILNYYSCSFFSIFPIQESKRRWPGQGLWPLRPGPPNRNQRGGGWCRWGQKLFRSQNPTAIAHQSIRIRIATGARGTSPSWRREIVASPTIRATCRHIQPKLRWLTWMHRFNSISV